MANQLSRFNGQFYTDNKIAIQSVGASNIL
jgi:hypothetical protein